MLRITSGPRPAGTRHAAVAAIAVFMVGWATVVPAAASTAPERAEEGTRAIPVMSAKRLPVPDTSFALESASFWAWPEEDRAYFLTDGQASGFQQLTMVELSTGSVIESVKFPSGVFGYSGGAPGGFGQPQSMIVDRERGLLYVGYQYSLLQPVRAERGQACVSSLGGPCFRGLLIYDARNLALTGRIDLQLVNLDGMVPLPHLHAMTLSPPRGPGDKAKIHLLIADYTYQAPAALFLGSNLRQSLQQNLHYLIQIDVDSGRQDWALRLDACRGARAVSHSERQALLELRPYPGAVYRSPSLVRPMIVVGCLSGSALTGLAVQVPLDHRDQPAVLPLAPGDPAGASEDFVQSRRPPPQQQIVQQAQTPLTVSGPDKTIEILSDPAADRLLFKVVDARAEVWWVYDNNQDSFIGTVGLGPTSDLTEELFDSTAALDTETGRLYVVKPKVVDRNFDGGLFIADMRRTPVAQALNFPQFAELAVSAEAGGSRSAVVVPALGGSPPRFFMPSQASVDGGFYRVIEDRFPRSIHVTADTEYAGRTLDVEEIAGATQSVADGAARGFGARVLLVGGADAAARLGPVDPVGFVYQCHAENIAVKVPGPCRELRSVKPVDSPCTSSNRDVTLGFVGAEGPAVVDATGARGAARPVAVDAATRADGEAAVSRCSGEDWDEVFAKALFSREPMDEPVAPWMLGESPAACVSGDETSSSSVGDPVAGSWAAATACDESEASGFAYVRGANVGGADIGEALSSFRVYRDPGRGIVARVESVARGVSIGGVLRIDTVRGTAESWANGRRFVPPEPEEGKTYSPNCDFERTAGTCFQRHIFGVWTPGYSCGPCGDEATFADRVSRGMGAQAQVRLRKPDSNLAKGADNGFIAAVTKPEPERFADLVLNNDLLQTIVPAMEVIRYAPPGRPLTGGGPRGRQILQFAAVEVSSSYAIQCLLVYDEALNTCGAPDEPPASITVSLADQEGKPLAGGAFEIRRDVDADGVAGLQDALLPQGACLTADDGVGTCKLEGLPPGGYLVTQTAAPPGYARVADPFRVDLASGEARTVAFTNVSNISAIDLTVTDEAGKPLAGAVFAAYPDPDADGKIDANAEPAATCTTGPEGACVMQVPAGSYVLVQTAAPPGLELIEPVAFTFAMGGQTAAVGVTNYRSAADGSALALAASPVFDYSDPVDLHSPVDTLALGSAPNTTEPAVTGPSVSLPDVVGGTVVRVIRAPGDALRLLARDPREAAAFCATLILAALSFASIRRRRMLLLVHQD